jgi:hypothetical protein
LSSKSSPPHSPRSQVSSKLSDSLKVISEQLSSMSLLCADKRRMKEREKMQADLSRQTSDMMLNEKERVSKSRAEARSQLHGGASIARAEVVLIPHSRPSAETIAAETMQGTNARASRLDHLASRYKDKEHKRRARVRFCTLFNAPSILISIRRSSKMSILSYAPTVTYKLS